MKEVEIKFRVSDRQILMTTLEKAGVKLGPIVYQNDVSFTPKDWDSTKTDQHVSFLRIRKQNDKQIFTLKQPVSNGLDKLEYETEVSDSDQMQKIITTLGFTEDCHIIKERQKAKLGQYEICVDKVEVLGDFIEIEKIVEEDVDGGSVQQELRDFLFELLGGSDGLEEVDRGYDVLMREK